MRKIPWLVLAVAAVSASGALAEERGRKADPEPDRSEFAQQECREYYPPSRNPYMFKACVDTILRARDACGPQATSDEKPRSLLGQLVDSGTIFWLKRQINSQLANIDQQSKQLAQCHQQFKANGDLLKKLKDEHADAVRTADELQVQLASAQQAHNANPVQVVRNIVGGRERPNPMAVLAGIFAASTVLLGTALAAAGLKLHAKLQPSVVPATHSGQLQFLAWAGQQLKPATAFQTADAALPELKGLWDGLTGLAGKYQHASGQLRQYGLDLSPQSLAPDAMAGATARLRMLASPILVQGLQSARECYTNLERNPDYSAFERATELRTALEDCAKALSPVFAAKPEEREAALSAALLDGLGSSWLRNILRADALLAAYAGTHTPWAELGFMLTSFATNVRLVLAGSGYQLMTHPLLSPAGAMTPTVMYSDERGIRHIRFVREAVEAAVSDLPDASSMVVDSLVFGHLGPNKRGQRPIVVLYSPTEWQA